MLCFWHPRDLGLGLTVHQATKSKDLVQLLHAAGNSVSYETVLRSDTTIAYDMISRYYDQRNLMIPRSFGSAKFLGYVRYANDNLDINPETLAGKNSFHVSQTVAYSTKGAADEVMTNTEIKMGHSKSLKLPSDFLNLSDAPDTETKSVPLYHISIPCSMHNAIFMILPLAQ